MEYFNQLDSFWKHLIIAAIIFIGAAITTRIARWLINRAMRTAEARFGVDRTKYAFFKNAISLIIWILALALVISTVPELKALAVTLFAGAGILVAAIGFAAQQSFANIVSGIFIVFFKPFRVGDMIRVQAHHGIVEDITLQHTVIVNFENKRIIIPNSIIGNEYIINDSIEEEKVCRWIEIESAMIVTWILQPKSFRKWPWNTQTALITGVHRKKAKGQQSVNVRLMEFGNSSVNLRAYVWTDDPFNAIQMHSDINRAIKKRFDNEGVEIPFPYHTIVYKKDLPPNAKLT